MVEGYILDKIYDVKIEDVYLYYIDEYWVKKVYFEKISEIRDAKLSILGIK
jgi:hypothetical protein